MSDESITTGMTQYLTFKLDDEIYALEISKVHSVLDFIHATKVPRTPDYMRGVINLRGMVVPIIDLKLRFGMRMTEKTVDTCVIIAELELEGDKTVLGVMADSVQEVMDLENNQIEPPPKIGSRLKTEFIKGMGKRGEDFIIILDLDMVFTGEDLAEIQGAGRKVESAAA
jgi:purine-binding chemotaxis protein CheW